MRPLCNMNKILKGAVFSPVLKSYGLADQAPKTFALPRVFEDVSKMKRLSGLERVDYETRGKGP
jgi:hypothetical protein